MTANHFQAQAEQAHRHMSDDASDDVRAAPIGVFDSGVGGLSVVQDIYRTLPNESIVYFADSGYAPYGEKTQEDIIARSVKITDFLLQFQIKALVVACNTATAAAVITLRKLYPNLPIIGMEPGLKPAIAATRSKRVGVLATKSTLQSEKFNQLKEQLTREAQVDFFSQPCVGLVNQIEQGQLNAPETLELIRKYVTPLIDQGVDTLVLGCTHYLFVAHLIEQVISENLSEGNPNLPRKIALISTGIAVARRLQSQLEEQHLLNIEQNKKRTPLIIWSTGNVSALHQIIHPLMAHSVTPDIEINAANLP